MVAKSRHIDEVTKYRDFCVGTVVKAFVSKPLEAPVRDEMPDLSVLTVITLAELAVIILVISLLVYAAVRGFLSTRFLPVSSLVMLLSGVALAGLAASGGHFFVLLLPSLQEQMGSAEPGFFTLKRVQWIATNTGVIMIAIGLFVAVKFRKQAEEEFVDTRRELEVSKYFEYQAEERFRYLFDSTSNSVYCYRFDPPMPVDLPIEEQVDRSHSAILQDCNVNFARDLEADDPSEVIGSLFGHLDSCKDTATHEAYFKAFVDGNYRLDGYDLSYKTPAGEERALRINMVGIVREGLLHRMWAVENNILDLRQTKAALERRRAYQELVASVSAQLVKASDEDADVVVRGCMQSVCEFIGANRSTMFWIDSDTDVASIAYMWGPDGSAIAPVAMDRFPEFARQLRSFRPVQIDDVANLPEKYRVDRSSLEALDLKSLLIIPMVIGGRTVGGLSCGRLQEQKSWTDQDVNDLTVFAELFANFVLRLRSRIELSRAMEKLRQATERLEAENVYLRQEIELTHGFDDIVGQSDAILRSLQLVEQVAPTKTPVLVMGETGTGKELVARAIHELSDRRDRALVKVNCAALPANLIESELFGHEKGAFTGADGPKRGRFDLAHGSTLFLDEIGEIPVELQAKLLRVLQEGEFDRLGGTKTIKVDVRLVVATNRNLTDAVQAGEFRSDLYYRINTFPIEIPALRERGDDIQLLTEHFVNVHAVRLGREVTAISAEMMNQLRRYTWPGNVRELEGIVQRALISSIGPVLELAEPLANDSQEPPLSAGTSNISDLKLVEREHIVAVLEDADWKISGNAGAAAKLGIPPSTLRSKMKKLAILRPH